MSDRARDNLNVTLFKYFIKYFHNLTCFPSSNLLSQLGHSFSGDLEEDIVFTPTVCTLFHPNCTVFSSMYSHCCSCDLVLVAKEINRFVSGRECTERARLKFWLEFRGKSFFCRKRVSLFKENSCFQFKSYEDLLPRQSLTKWHQILDKPVKPKIRNPTISSKENQNLLFVPHGGDFVLLASLDLVSVRVGQRCVALR